MSQELKKIASSTAGGFRKLAQPLLMVSVIAAASISGTAAASNSLTFQGVTFNTWAIDGDSLGFSILNATGATGDWSGIQSLAAFGLKNIGSVTGATVVSGPGSFSSTFNELNALGCEGGNSGGMCLFSTPPATLADSMTWNIDFSGPALDFSKPTLKVEFLDAFGSKQGSLLSQQIPVSPVNEPGTYAMLLAGLGLIAFVTRRRHVNQTSPDDYSNGNAEIARA